MNYKEIRDALFVKGFVIEGIQTDSYIEMPSFMHPTISGEVHVSFDECDFEEGTELDYVKGKNLENIKIRSVEFLIDAMSISYLGETLPTGGEDEENTVFLGDDDVDKYFHKTLALACDKYTMLNFSKEYGENMTEFMEGIKRFIPIIEKYNFNSGCTRSSGHKNTLYSDIQVFFEYQGRKYDYLVFDMSTLSFDKKVVIRIASEVFEMELDGDLDVFEKELARQVQMCDKIMELYQKQQDDRKEK